MLSSFLWREKLSLILGLILVAGGLNLFLAPKGLRDLDALRRHRARLERSLEELRAGNASLRGRVDKLTSDDRYLRNLIRKELGFVRRGELVYKFAGDSATPSR